MLRREYIILHEPEPVDIQPSTHHRPAVLLYEVGEIVRIDDSFLNTSCFHNAALEPTLIDPPLHFIAAYMQGFRQAVDCEPIATSLRAFAQAMQHGTNGVC